MYLSYRGFPRAQLGHRTLDLKRGYFIPQVNDSKKCSNGAAGSRSGTQTVEPAPQPPRPNPRPGPGPLAGPAVPELEKKSRSKFQLVWTPESVRIPQ